MSELLKKSVETFRTAPVAVTRMAVSAGALLADMKVLAHNPEAYQAAPIPLILASIAIGGLKTVERSRRRAQLERSIEKNGFDERVFAVTTKAWCARQTARVVCRDTGHLAEYEALCESEDDALHKWLPHVP
jgi:hypothetical protein